MAEAAPVTGELAVRGLAETLAGLKQMESGLYARMRSRLVAAADQAASYAVFIAQQKGLYQSGELIERIKSGFRNYYAYITDTASRVSPAYPQGFNYPRVYEYGGSETRGNQWGKGFKIRNRSTTGTRLIAQHGIGEGFVGPRAFLWPAATEGEPGLYHSLELMIDELASSAGLTVV
jgi:hypothetical protein